jgi:hypothetical protein
VDPQRARRAREPGRHLLPAELNEAALRRPPGHVQTIAEESTAWPMVSRPVYDGRPGLRLKWDMGWMHDTLRYFRRDPVHRRFHHGQLTFRSLYAFHENFVLPLSHDEVVHGKGSLLGKMPGDDWQKFANLRLLLRPHVGAPGQEAAVHGRRVRPAPRVEPRQASSTGATAVPVAAHGQYQALNLTLPPLGVRDPRTTREPSERDPTSEDGPPIALDDGRVRVVIENIRRRWTAGASRSSASSATGSWSRPTVLPTATTSWPVTCCGAARAPPTGRRGRCSRWPTTAGARTSPSMPSACGNTPCVPGSTASCRGGMTSAAATRSTTCGWRRGPARR